MASKVSASHVLKLGGGELLPRTPGLIGKPQSAVEYSVTATSLGLHNNTIRINLHT
jgi:hypothetical protein